MSLLHLNKISLRYAEQPLLDQVELRINAQEKIALIGRNGAGKTTLLKLIAGEIEADSGSITRNSDKIARMSQTNPADLDLQVENYLQKIQLEHSPWASPQTIDRIISQLQLTRQSQLKELSGGQLRRVLLAAALVQEPDILLLDEPTNHMDFETIQWLENFLQRTDITLILITHDREFMQQVANRIIEIDRGQLRSCKGSYQHFLKFRQQQLAAEKTAADLFDKRLSEEEVWIRQGIKARRTRNEGRVRALKKMRQQYAQRRSQQGQLKLQQHQLSSSSKQVILADNISFLYQEKTIFKDFSTIIHRQDRIGIIGPNGCGKTTLIQCLLKQLEPSVGEVKLASQIEIAYFDQHRTQLDYDLTPVDIVGQGRQSITINGKEKHIISYLQDFLFTPQQARAPITKLSGGECNRLLLAKLFTQPADLLVLDEPTNDLDIESLELLEEYLSEYPGTVLVISHDRALLDNVVTSTLVFSENATITQYAGGYQDYLQQVRQAQIESKAEDKQLSSGSRLSYDERKELNRLPAKIAKLEQKIQAQGQLLADLDYTDDNIDQIKAQQATLAQLQQELEAIYQRWELLMDKEANA
jgi:ABC transport system ATP-binding/permease protein